jgi:hypothetical protein
MLSSHRESLLPYAPGRRAAVLLDHRRYRPNVEVAPSCPRCDSPNTKFCYYNNYSLSQPRYFCKGCRRYWTKGGSLRNVPVGGGCRKNRSRGKPVRAVPVDSVAPSSGGAAAFTHRASSSSASSPATLRPDMLLEGMIGSPGGLCQLTVTDDDAAENPAVAPDGPRIDLALLYAKFLNHQPPAPERRASAVLPESLVDTLSGSSSSDVGPVVPSRDHQPFTTQDDVLGELSATASAEPSAPPPQSSCADALIGAFGMDQRCYDSLGLPPDAGDLVLPTPSTWHLLGAKYELFDPLPEDAVSLQDGFAGDEDVWSGALACQGLEAALCRP